MKDLMAKSGTEGGFGIVMGDGDGGWGFGRWWGLVGRVAWTGEKARLGVY